MKNFGSLYQKRHIKTAHALSMKTGSLNQMTYFNYTVNINTEIRD